MRGWRGKGGVSFVVFLSMQRVVNLSPSNSVAEDQYNDIISASDAWHLSDDADEETINEKDVRSTNSARRVKALIEQITGVFAVFV